MSYSKKTAPPFPKDPFAQLYNIVVNTKTGEKYKIPAHKPAPKFTPPPRHTPASIRVT